MACPTGSAADALFRRGRYLSPPFFRTARSCLICTAANAKNTEKAPKAIQSHFGNQLQRDQSSTVVSSPLPSRMATATSVMAVVIPTQNRNAAVATDNTTKVMAINLKIPLKLALPYEISSAFDDWTVGGRSSNCANCSREGSPWFPGPSVAPSLLALPELNYLKLLNFL